MPAPNQDRLLRISTSHRSTPVRHTHNRNAQRGGHDVAERLLAHRSVMPEISFRNPQLAPTDPAVRVRFLACRQQNSAPTKANPSKDGDAKPRAYSPHPGIWPPSRRRHLSGSESAALILLRIEGFVLPRPQRVRSSAVAGSTLFDPGTARTPRTTGAAEHVVRLIHFGSTSAAGRGHATPTPDPDPRGPGQSTPCALRSCEFAPSVPPDTAPTGREDGATGSSRGLQPSR